MKKNYISEKQETNDSGREKNEQLKNEASKI